MIVCDAQNYSATSFEKPLEPARQPNTSPLLNSLLRRSQQRRTLSGALRRAARIAGRGDDEMSAAVMRATQIRRFSKQNI
jgi:hypothetical protein